MNEIREKVIEVLENYNVGYPFQNQLADALISLGLIFNPETDIRTKFKIGQKVYVKKSHSIYIGLIDGYFINRELKVDYTFYDTTLASENNIFLTESEAQAALGEIHLTKSLE